MLVISPISNPIKYPHIPFDDTSINIKTVRVAAEIRLFRQVTFVRPKLLMIVENVMSIYINGHNQASIWM